jgi:hypothetical protein
VGVIEGHQVDLCVAAIPPALDAGGLSRVKPLGRLASIKLAGEGN